MKGDSFKNLDLAKRAQSSSSPNENKPSATIRKNFLVVKIDPVSGSLRDGQEEVFRAYPQDLTSACFP
jgi:hypothetical protein